MDTVTLTIDGRQVTVEKGKTVLQAAIESGISVPYYCYHPGIGIDGSCRVCIVKIEKMPKLQTSCSTLVRRRHGRAARGRPRSSRRAPACSSSCSINHPLDCPVCDKGGECPLQDFSYTFGPDQSRMEFPRRVFDGEGVKARRRLRADADAQPQPLHPVHALRPLHARGRRRRADQHHRSRLRQRDRDVPGRGRALAPLGQPDGRLPGRRDHDARLPLQVAAVGQPERRRHDLHAVLEGLQHDGVDQGEAGVGEGLAARSASRRGSTPTSTATGCATSAASTTTGSKATIACAGRSCATPAASQQPVSWHDVDADAARPAGGRRPRRIPDGVRFLLSAHASHEELFLFRRLAEELLGDAAKARHASAGGIAPKPQPASTTVQGARRSTRRTSTARALFGLRAGTSATSRRGRPVGAARRRSRPAACRRSTCSIPGPDGSIGDTRWIVDARAARHAAAAHRPGRAADRRWRAPPTSCCRAHRTSRRKRPIRTTRDGCRAPRARSRRRATRWKTGRFSSTSAPRSASRSTTRRAAQVRADIAARVRRRRRRSTGSPTLAFARPVAARHWLQASNPSERWKWDFMFQDLPPVKGDGRSVGAAAAAGRDPARKK